MPWWCYRLASNAASWNSDSRRRLQTGPIRPSGPTWPPTGPLASGFFPHQECSPCQSCSQSHCYWMTAPYQKRPLCPHGRLHWGCEEAPAERSSGAGSSVADSRATPSGLPSDAQTPTNWPDLDSSGLKAPEATERMTLTSSLKHRGRSTRLSSAAAWNGDPGS